MKINDFMNTAEGKISEVEQALCNRYFSAVSARAGVNIVGRSFNIKEDGGTIYLNLNGPFTGWGVDINAILARLSSMEKPEKVVMQIQSPGGYMSSGLGLYNALRSYSRDGVAVEAIAGGIVASAAALAFLGADTRKVSKESTLMYHPPMSFMFAFGSREEITHEFTKTSSGLGAMEKLVLAVFDERLGNNSLDNSASKEDIWLVGSESVDKGVATEVMNDSSGEAQDGKETNQISEAPALDPDLKSRARAALAFTDMIGGFNHERF